MQIDEYIDLSKLNKLKPAKGRVILSEPFMLDSNFKRAVILLCEHNKEGSFGFILNNILSVNLSEMVQGLDSNEFIISYGGPVHPDNLYYIHDQGDIIEDSQELFPGLWFGGNFEQILSMINDKKIHAENIRFFLGYAGWSEEQLELEMESHSWITSEFIPNDLMKIDKDLWKNTLNKMGKQYEVVSNFPSDPSHN